MLTRHMFLVLALAACGAGELEEVQPPSGVGLVPASEFGPELHGGQVEGGGLALGDDGTLAILDAMARRVFVLTPSSAAGSVFGREGGGPGEFTGPRILALTGDGTVAVFDRALRRLSFWSSVGHLVEERHLPWNVWAMHGESSSILVKVGRDSPLEDGSFSIFRVTPGQDGSDALFRHDTPAPAADAVPPGSPLPQVCSSCPFFRLPGGDWVFQPAGFTDQIVRVGPESRVEVVWSRGRGMEPEPISREEWLEESRRLHDASRAMATDLSPALGANFPPFDPTLSGERPPRRWLSSRGAMGLDHRGRLWTLPNLPPDLPPLLEVHDASGTFLGGITLTKRPVQMIVRREWLALVFEDDLGLGTVHLFRIEDTGASDEGRGLRSE